MTRATLAVAVLLAAAAWAEAPPTVEPGQIPAYRRLRPDLAVGGQPSPDALGRLGEMGFHTVVNLRTAAEGAEREKEVVEAQGLHYVWIPVTPQTFSLADVEAVERILDDPSSGPVLLHCASSNRVGGVWEVIQARRGRSPAEAEASGKEAGLHSPAMAAAVRRVLGAPGAPAPVNP